MYGALSLKYFPPSPVTHLCQWVFAAASTSLDEHVSAPALLPFEIKNYWLCILWRIWGGGYLVHIYIVYRHVCVVVRKRLLALSCLSIGPSIRMSQHRFHGTDFCEIWCWGLYENLSRRSKFG